MSHTALLLVKGDFHQIYCGIKEHHNRHHLQGSRMFETDCDCRLRLQYFEDANHMKELFQMVRKQLRIINARLQMRYPSRNHSNRNATHLERMRVFLLKQKKTYAKEWVHISEQYFNDFLMEYVDWSEPTVVYRRLDFTNPQQHFNFY